MRGDCNIEEKPLENPMEHPMISRGIWDIPWNIIISRKIDS
jgi:hypothetical protein